MIQSNAYIKNLIKQRLKFEEIKETDVADDILRYGVACLLAFVQDNFTGPDLDVELNTVLGIDWPADIEATKLLSVDGEEINQNVKKPELLLISRMILENLAQNFDYNFVSN